MPPQAVLDALGGSIAGGELKGDYAAAETAAVAALEAARAGADPHAIAEAAIWASVVAALRSEGSAAAARRKEALAALPDHPLGPAVRHFANGADRVMPDGNVSMWIFTTTPDDWPEPTTADPLESELYALTVLPVRSAAIQLAVNAEDPTKVAGTLEDGLRALAPVWDERPHARLAAAELCRGAGAQDRAEEHLDAATKAYSAAGDVAGLARCDLARGAWPAVTAGSPLTLGLALPEYLYTAATEPSGVLDRRFASVPDADASAAFYQRAEDGFRAAGAPRGVATVDLHRAAVAALHDDPATALEAAERARAAYKAAGDLAGAHLAAAHAALARVHAREWPERIEVATAIGAWGLGPGSLGWALGIGIMFSQVGWRWLRRDGDADCALACHRLAEATFTALGVPEFAQQTFADRAVAHGVAGDRDAALAECGRALRALADVQAQHPEGSVMDLRAGNVAIFVRAYADATLDADLLDRIRPMLERQRASLLALAEDPARASQKDSLTELAADITRGLVWDAPFIPLYRALAARRRNPLQFRSLLQAALEATAAAPGDDRVRLEAWVLLLGGDAAAARKAVADRPPAEPADVAGLVADAGLFVRLEAWPQARRCHEALEQLLPGWWEQETQPWWYLGRLARTAEGLEELDRAGELYEGALARLDEQRGRVARRDARGTSGDVVPEAVVYGDAARAVLLRMPEAATAALELAEHARARGLLARMAGSAALAAGSAAQAKELREWRELAARLEVVRSLAARGDDGPAAELAAAEAALQAIETKLAAADPRWLDAVSPPGAVLGADEIRAALPDGTVLIEHLLVGGALIGWAITPDGPVRAHLSPTDDVATDELQRKLWTACQGRSPLWQRFAEQLGDALLAPFDDAIAASRHVVLVPHRWGHVAPLPAIYWRGAPLLTARAVSVLPSASALRFVPAPAPPRKGRLLAVGDPTNMSRRRPGEAQASGGFGALPWSAAQAAEAAGWLGTDAPLLGAAAREQAVRDGIAGASIVHFATHGVLDEAPLLSCIVLAEGDTLDVWELLGLPLDADLVTLSACDSGGTPVTPGDEITGLAWLTLAAGARAVAASLWKVSELSTALLMRAFYGALRDGRPPREALAEAQRHMSSLTPATAAPEIAALRAAAVAAGRPDPGEPADLPEDFSHPFHWAGFVLIGV